MKWIVQPAYELQGGDTVFVSRKD